MKIWTEISEERLAENFRALERILFGEKGSSGANPASLMAVVKANAYGHGIEPCAAVLARAGAEWLGVTDAHEGARVRAALRRAAGAASQSPAMGGPDAPGSEEPEVLVMSGTAGLCGEAECVVRERLTAVVWEAAHVERLAEAARAAEMEARVPVHLEVDSGMSRQGAAPGAELDAILRVIGKEPRILLDGVMTHFASTEVAGSAQTESQQRGFASAIGQLAAAGIRPRWVHAGNSSYIDNANEGIDNAAAGTGKAGAGSCSAADTNCSLTWLRSVAGRIGARAMVRSGLALYGYLLPIEGPGRPLARPCVRPVMTWKTRVIGLRDVPAGALVGYNGTFAAERPMRLALLPVGYADGLRRELSSTSERSGGWVMVRGERAPIVGRVSMNLTTVDVSGIPGAVEGDEAVLIGEGVSAEDHAKAAGTIAYEILCGVRTAE